jgi:hypothetical protein
MELELRKFADMRLKDIRDLGTILEKRTGSRCAEPYDGRILASTIE